MRFQLPGSVKRWLFPVLVLVVVIAGILLRQRWLPQLTDWVTETVQSQRPAAEADEDHDAHDAEHSHAGHAHDESTSLELSEQARRNIGLTKEYVAPIRLQTYRRHITVPAVIVERPGRTTLQVSTPLTGIVTHVHSVVGEAIEPGALLFELRLTHEDLVKSQTEFVKTLGELDVEKRELNRLKDIGEGAVAGRLVLERQYAIDKLTALLNAQRESLRLHGLTDEQIKQVESDRRLLKMLSIYAPFPDVHSDEEYNLTDSAVRTISHTDDQAPPLVVQNLRVHKGQSVTAGESLCTLDDFSELYVEGRAFERDANAVTYAVKQNWSATALFEDPGGYTELPGLSFAFLSNVIDRNSRTLSFYVTLPNRIVRDERNARGQRYVSWQYRLGQRLQLRVPVEEWQNQFVLPVDAVVNEGAESYVFQQNGNHFDRVPVHVKYKDQTSVVIANDGSLFPGDRIAQRGAHQMQMTLKNKAGGGADPHAGHHHH